MCSHILICFFHVEADFSAKNHFRIFKYPPHFFFQNLTSAPKFEAHVSYALPYSTAKFSQFHNKNGWPFF